MIFFADLSFGSSLSASPLFCLFKVWFLFSLVVHFCVYFLNCCRIYFGQYLLLLLLFYLPLFLDFLDWAFRLDNFLISRGLQFKHAFFLSSVVFIRYFYSALFVIAAFSDLPFYDWPRFLFVFLFLQCYVFCLSGFIFLHYYLLVLLFLTSFVFWFLVFGFQAGRTCMMDRGLRCSVLCVSTAYMFWWHFFLESWFWFMLVCVAFVWLIEGLFSIHINVFFFLIDIEYLFLFNLFFYCLIIILLFFFRWFIFCNHYWFALLLLLGWTLHFFPGSRLFFRLGRPLGWTA